MSRSALRAVSATKRDMEEEGSCWSISRRVEMADMIEEVGQEGISFAAPALNFCSWMSRHLLSFVDTAVNRLRFGCYSQVLSVAYSYLLAPTDALVSAQVLASSMLSACYYLDRHCVLRSLVTPS